MADALTPDIIWKIHNGRQITPIIIKIAVRRCPKNFSFEIVQFFSKTISRLKLLKSFRKFSAAVFTLKNFPPNCFLVTVCNSVTGLQVVMTSVVRAMFPLMQVLFLVIFVIIIYAIIGLEFLRGRFRWTCYNKATNQCKLAFFILVLVHLDVLAFKEPWSPKDLCEHAEISDYTAVVGLIAKLYFSWTDQITGGGC